MGKIKYTVKYGELMLLFNFFVCSVWAQNYKYPYSSFRERDPLKPLVDESGNILIKERKQMGDFFLQGIIYSPTGSQVIINNEVYREGDKIEEYKIKKIEAYQVIFEKEGEEFILKWEE